MRFEDSGLFLFTSHNVLRASAVVCGLCTFVISILATRSYAPLALSFKRSTRLERVDQFSRLNPTNCTTHAKQSFINHAPILTQIDEARPTYVYPDDAGRFMTTAGMVSPEDRHFVVADSVHTIAQFRVMDFDYEDCQVVIEVPSQDVLDTVWSKSISLSHDIVGVDIWRLADDSEFVDPRTLSWKTRPRRVDQSPLVTLDIAIGASVVSQRFPCKQDAVIGFEVGCRGENCSVDFWQDRREPRLAMYVLQRPAECTL